MFRFFRWLLLSLLRATLPLDLVLVRHGESEGNVAIHEGGNAFQGALGALPSSLWELTVAGRDQAISAGAWLRKVFPSGFGRYYVSPYLRTAETALSLHLENAEWRDTDPRIIERSWGDLERRTDEEQREAFTRSLSDKTIDPLHWRPPNGESLSDVFVRVHSFLATLARDCPNEPVIVVCHSETMRVFQLIIERIGLSHLRDVLQDPAQDIRNCQVVHYSRRDPISGRNSKRLDWKRTVVPWDRAPGDDEWIKIERQPLSNRELGCSITDLQELREEVLDQ